MRHELFLPFSLFLLPLFSLFSSWRICDVSCDCDFQLLGNLEASGAAHPLESTWIIRSPSVLPPWYILLTNNRTVNFHWFTLFFEQLRIQWQCSKVKLQSDWHNNNQSPHNLSLSYLLIHYIVVLPSRSFEPKSSSNHGVDAPTDRPQQRQNRCVSQQGIYFFFHKEGVTFEQIDEYSKWWWCQTSICACNTLLGGWIQICWSQFWFPWSCCWRRGKETNAIELSVLIYVHLLNNKSDMCLCTFCVTRM